MALSIEINTDAARAATERLERNLRSLGTEGKRVEKDVRQLEQRLQRGMGADRSKQSMDRLERQVKATRGEMTRMQLVSRRLSGGFTSMGGAVKGTIAKLASFKTMLAGVGVSVGLILGIRSAVNAFAKFEEKLVDMGKVTDKPIKQIRDQIMALPAELGSATQLMEGYYNVISAGVQGEKQQIDTLVAASKAAKAAHVDQGEIIKGLTAIMEAYGDKVEDVNEAADLLFLTEKQGKTTVAELIPVIGGLTAVSAELGIHQNEMGAALSQITKLTGGTAEAATRYEAVLTGLIKPTEDMIKLMAEYGGVQGAIQELGFEETLRKIQEAAGGSAEKLGKLFGRKEAIMGFISLAKNDFEGFNRNLEEFKNKAGAADRAFGEWRGTFNAVKDEWSNTIGKLGIELGERIAPTLQGMLEDFSSWVDENKEMILKFFDSLGYAIRGVGSAASWAGRQIATFTNYTADVGKSMALLVEGQLSFEEAKRAAFAGPTELREIIDEWEMKKGFKPRPAKPISSDQLMEQLAMEYKTGRIEKVAQDIVSFIRPAGGALPPGKPPPEPPSDKGEAERLKRELEQLAEARLALESEMTMEMMSQTDQRIAQARMEYDERVELINELAKRKIISEAEETAMIEQAAYNRVYKEAMVRKEAMDIALAGQKELEREMTLETATEAEKRTLEAEWEYEARIKQMELWLEKGYLTEQEFTDMTIQAAESRDEKLKEKSQETADFMAEINKEVARSMQNEMSDFFFDAIKGEMDSFEDYWNAFTDALYRIWADQMAKMAAESMFGEDGLGGMLGGLFKGGGGGGEKGKGGGNIFSSITGFIGGLFGFQHGGAFTVPGGGGPDSRLVAFKASPGEEVTVTPPSKSDMRQTIINFHQTIKTPDVGGFRRSQRQIMAESKILADMAAKRNK